MGQFENEHGKITPTNIEQFESMLRKESKERKPGNMKGGTKQDYRKALGAASSQGGLSSLRRRFWRCICCYTSAIHLVGNGFMGACLLVLRMVLQRAFFAVGMVGAVCISLDWANFVGCRVIVMSWVTVAATGIPTAGYRQAARALTQWPPPKDPFIIFISG